MDDVNLKYKVDEVLEESVSGARAVGYLKMASVTCCSDAFLTTRLRFRN